jgi:hypothetical protein
MRPIKAKINVTKILKDRLFTGKSGIYLDLVIWPNKQPSQYGDTHVIKQELSKEAREAGEQEPIIGNLTMPEDEAPPPHPRRPPPRQAPRQAPRPPQDPDLDVPPDDIPF